VPPFVANFFSGPYRQEVCKKNCETAKSAIKYYIGIFPIGSFPLQFLVVYSRIFFTAASVHMTLN
jgi:hypothetical protein